MTTRPSVARLPPQRSQTSTGPGQRPPPLRTHSQQFASSSPTRRGNEPFVDLTFDGDAARSRLGNTPLRLEISTDSKHADVESPKPLSLATPTWRPPHPPRGRPRLPFDVASVGRPGAQDGGQHEVTYKPMPLPARPGQYAPPVVEKQRPVPTHTAKKDARPKPYTLEVPAAAPRYSPNGT